MDSRIKMMTTIITSLRSERSGCIEPRQPKTPYTVNRRANRINALRREIRLFKKLFKRARIEGYQPLEVNQKPTGELSSIGGEGKKDQKAS